jgi:hypothetical protein
MQQRTLRLVDARTDYYDLKLGIEPVNALAPGLATVIEDRAGFTDTPLQG